MRRVLIAAFAALILGIGLIRTQPTEAWLAQAPAAAAYTGPGDVVSSARAWWGLRCYNTAYSGNVADVWDGATGSTTETLITCSPGGTLNTGSPTALATTCAVSCKIKTLYDESGATACNGAACDLTQATNANRPVYTTNAIGSLPCMTFANATPTYLSKGATNFAQNQPLTYSTVFESTATAEQGILSIDNGTTYVELYREPSGDLALFAGSNGSATISSSTWYAAQGVFNDVSSTLYLNGSSNSVSPGSTNIASTFSIIIGADTSTGVTDGFTGCIVEAGVWDGAFNGTQQSNMNSNQRTYWGF